MTHTPPLYVLRHGETTWNRDGRLQGHLDSPLTPMGRDQAAAQHAILATALPPGAQAISSDSGRALETARIVLDGLDVPLRREPRLREVALGDWQGLTVAEIEAKWGWLTADRDPLEWKFDAPGGESLDAFVTRIDAVLATLSGPTIIVTHGLTSRVLRCRALGLPPEALGTLPGGQGVVHVVEDGSARILRP